MLSWVNRLIRVRVHCPQLCAWQTKVHRTSNAYVFRDPGSKSEMKPGTASQDFKLGKSVGAPTPLSAEPDLLSALQRLAKEVCRRQRSGGIAV